MSSKIVRGETALQDLDHQAEFIQQDSPEAAIRFLEAASEAFELLADMPELGGVCEFSSPKTAGIRVWAIKGFEKHLIFYRPIHQGVEIIRLLHGRRDIAAVFEEDPR